MREYLEAKYRKGWSITGDGIHHRFGNGYMISYNPSTVYTLNLYKLKDPLFQFDQDVDTEETALYINSSNSYLILNGDFRKEYERCKTLEACLKVFRKYESDFRSIFCSGIDSI